MNYILLATTILFAVMNNVLLHRFNDKEERCNIFVFNGFVSLLWCILLLIVGGGIANISLYNALFGMFYGIVMALFLLFKMLSLGNGPVSITTLVNGCSLIIPTLYGTIVWKEPIEVSQVIGMLLLLISLYCVIGTKNAVKIRKNYFLYLALSVIFTGTSGIAMKWYAKSGATEGLNDMMIMASLTAMCVFFVIYAIDKKIKAKQTSISFKTDRRKKIIRRSLKYVLLCGITSCFYQRINPYLAGELPSIVFFPIFNGMVIFLACIAGVWLFKEKFTKRQALGILMGFVSIILIGNIL